MAQDMRDVRTAAIKFLNQIENAVDVTLVDFDTESPGRALRRHDYPRLIERIRARKPDGWTALYDAIGVYLNGASTQTGQKVLVAYTDGGDTRSSINAGGSDRSAEGLGRHRLRDRLPGAPVAAPAQPAAWSCIGFDDHRRAGLLSVQPERSRQDVREDPERRSPPATASATSPPTTRTTGRPLARRQDELSPDLKDAKLRTRAGYYAPLERELRSIADGSDARPPLAVGDEIGEKPGWRTEPPTPVPLNPRSL